MNTKIYNGDIVEYRGDLSKFSDEDHLRFDINTTHVCKRHGIFKYGKWEIQIPKSIFKKNPGFWMTFDSKSVCPICGRQSEYLGGEVFQVDNSIARSIYFLNMVGIETRSACEGHIYYDEKYEWCVDQAYINFTNDAFPQVDHYMKTHDPSFLYTDIPCIRAFGNCDDGRIGGFHSLHEAEQYKAKVLNDIWKMARYFMEINKKERLLYSYPSIPTGVNRDKKQKIVEQIDLTCYDPIDGEIFFKDQKATIIRPQSYHPFLYDISISAWDDDKGEVYLKLLRDKEDTEEE